MKQPEIQKLFHPKPKNDDKSNDNNQTTSKKQRRVDRFNQTVEDRGFEKELIKELKTVFNAKIHSSRLATSPKGHSKNNNLVKSQTQ